ncbi:MAG: glycosyltransferase family 39 protein [Motilibacteraceae bacterium]
MGGTGILAGPRAARTRQKALLAALLLIALLARLAVLVTPLAGVSGDEAAAALMARNIRQGHGYVFFAGQTYMASAVQYLQSLTLAVAPTSAFALRLPDLVLSLVACWLVHSVGLRVLRSRVAALLALALYAVGPAFPLVYASRASGAYNLALVLGLLTLRVSLTRGRTDRRSLLLGVLTGAGLWCSPVSVFLTGPALLWQLPALRADPRRCRPLVLGAVLGASPALVWSLVHQRLGGLGAVTAAPPGSTPLTRLGGLLTDVLPEELGLAWRDGRPLVPAALVVAVVAALLAAWAVAALRRRPSLARLLTARPGAVPADLVLVAAPLVALLYAASSYTWWTTEPRYLYLAGPWLVWGLAALAARTRRPRAAGAVLVAATMGLSALGLHAAGGVGRGTWRTDLVTASDWLAAHDVPAAYADYRPAFTATFVTGGQETVVPYDGQACRFPELARRAATLSQGRPVVGWLLSSAHRDELAPRLQRAGVVDELVLPTVTAYLVEAPAAPADVGLGSGPTCG